MKFFHLSDLHIGLKLINRDLTEDTKMIRLVSTIGFEETGEMADDEIVAVLKL